MNNCLVVSNHCKHTTQIYNPPKKVRKYKDGDNHQPNKNNYPKWHSLALDTCWKAFLRCTFWKTWPFSTLPLSEFTIDHLRPELEDKKLSSWFETKVPQHLQPATLGGWRWGFWDRDPLQQHGGRVWGQCSIFFFGLFLVPKMSRKDVGFANPQVAQSTFGGSFWSKDWWYPHVENTVFVKSSQVEKVPQHPPDQSQQFLQNFWRHETFWYQHKGHANYTTWIDETTSLRSFEVRPTQFNCQNPPTAMKLSDRCDLVRNELWLKKLQPLLWGIFPLHKFGCRPILEGLSDAFAATLYFVFLQLFGNGDRNVSLRLELTWFVAAVYVHNTGLEDHINVPLG